MKDLTATSYAILGLLAVKPWTTYELARQVERGMSNFWPRAASKLYEEPKNLVEHGMAKARKEYTGKRPRTVYAITAKGRRALASWLSVPGTGPAVEFEAFMKVFFAEHGDREALMANLSAAEAWAIENQDLGRTIARDHLSGHGPFPERLHVISLCYPLLWDLAATVKRWARWAETEVRRSPDAPAAGKVRRDLLRRAASSDPADDVFLCDEKR